MTLVAERQQLEEAQRHAEGWNAERVLRWAFATYDCDVAIASAFGAEGIVLLDIAAQVRTSLQVFTLDTGFLFPETLEMIEHVEARYGIRVQRLSPNLTPEEQGRVHGAALWSHNPQLCCQIRKIEPLKEKLAGLRAWITAIRRDQTAARAHAGKVEWDPNFGCVKINPLADWSEVAVWDYIRKQGLTYNRLHDRNYPSVGCTHCTRAVQVGEGPRAGRWSGFAKTECGLHDCGISKDSE